MQRLLRQVQRLQISALPRRFFVGAVLGLPGVFGINPPKLANNTCANLFWRDSNETHPAPCPGILLAAGLTLSVSAAEMDSRATHCFGPEEFSSGDGTLAGICLTALPEKHLGTVMLGERVLRPGDVLTACQVGEMTFVAGGAGGKRHRRHPLSACVLQRPCRRGHHDPVHPGQREQAPHCRGRCL